MNKSIEYLNEDTTRLNFYLNEEGSEKSELTPQMITEISRKCPNLKLFDLDEVDIQSWPNLKTPWMLKRLDLFEVLEALDEASCL